MQYEILVQKRGENNYAAYCPQLDLMVRGTAHAEVEEKLRLVIQEKTGELVARLDDSTAPKKES